jgi:hypothetical protein
VPFAVVEGWWADGAGVRAKDDPTGDDDDPTGALPEICQKLRYTQPRAAPRPQHSTVALTCSVAWGGEALHGDVSHPHINGMQGVKGSNPLSSTRHSASLVRPERLGVGGPGVH